MEFSINNWDVEEGSLVLCKHSDFSFYTAGKIYTIEKTELGSKGIRTDDGGNLCVTGFGKPSSDWEIIKSTVIDAIYGKEEV